MFISASFKGMCQSKSLGKQRQDHPPVESWKIHSCVPLQLHPPSRTVGSICSGNTGKSQLVQPWNKYCTRPKKKGCLPNNKTCTCIQYHHLEPNKSIKIRLSPPNENNNILAINCFHNQKTHNPTSTCRSLPWCASSLWCRLCPFCLSGTPCTADAFVGTQVFQGSGEKLCNSDKRSFDWVGFKRVLRRIQSIVSGVCLFTICKYKSQI